MLPLVAGAADEPLPSSYKDLSQPQIDSLVRLMLDDESRSGGCSLLFRRSTEYFDAYVVKVRGCAATCIAAVERLNERAGGFGIVFERTTSGCNETQERTGTSEGRDVEPVPKPTVPPPRERSARPEPASVVSVCPSRGPSTPAVAALRVLG